jgi:outer membrane protein OmpA-like peptidoglycan-associated protein
MADDHEDTGLASSLTDLMTSLMVIFILLLVATLNNAHQQGQNTRNNIIQELRKELRLLGNGKNGGNIEVDTDPNDPLGLVVIVPQHLLNFPFGQSQIPHGGKEFLKQFIPKFVGVVCSDRFRNDISSVVIEGHTDPVGSDEYNIGLSQNRATAVVEQSLAALNDPGQTTCLERILSVSGRGKGESLGQEKRLTEEQMAEQRRVQFKVRVKSAEERVFVNRVSLSSPPNRKVH